MAARQQQQRRRRRRGQGRRACQGRRKGPWEPKVGLPICVASPRPLHQPLAGLREEKGVVALRLARGSRCVGE